MLSSNIVNSNLNNQVQGQSQSQSQIQSQSKVKQYKQFVKSNKKNKKVLADKSLFIYTEELEIERDIIGFFLGKGKKNLESLQAISKNVILDFKRVNKNYSLITIKSNNKEEYLLVKNQLNNQFNLAYDKLKHLKETMKSIRKLKEKQRENKIRKELEEKVKRELENKHNFTSLQSTDLDTTRARYSSSTITHLEMNACVLNSNYNGNKTQCKYKEEDYIKPKNIFTLLEVE